MYSVGQAKAPALVDRTAIPCTGTDSNFEARTCSYMNIPLDVLGVYSSNYLYMNTGTIDKTATQPPDPATKQYTQCSRTEDEQLYSGGFEVPVLN